MSYKGGADIFYSVYGLGEGFYGLREMANNDSNIYEISPIIERQLKRIKENSEIKYTEKET